MNKVTSLDGWLQRLEQMQPDHMELGLSRIKRVAVLAGLDKPDFSIVTVGGTNGKGSTVAYIDELLRGRNLSTGVYTSPHFIDFNERIVVNGEHAAAEELCAAFELVENARDNIELTYFEFTTLAAIYCFGRRKVDVAVMEVGLGGRLDAVNAWDSEVACLTSVGIDHIDWLGDDREQIGYEKASIARAGCILVCGEPDPPASIATTAADVGATVLQAGRDFRSRSLDTGWEYSDAGTTMVLPQPAIPAEWAIGNASVAICVTRQLLGVQLPASEIASALRRVTVAGRMQRLDYRGVPVILDVAHNVDAAGLLSEHLSTRAVAGKTTAVFSCMQDKDIQAILRGIHAVIDHWCIAEIDSHRAIKLTQLSEALAAAGAVNVDVFTTVTTAFEQAVAQSSAADRVVVFGSFHAVGPVLALLAQPH